MDISDSQEIPEAPAQPSRASFPTVRTIIVGIVLILLFVIPYFGYPFFRENLVGLEGNFRSGIILLTIAIVVSAVAVYVRRSRKNKLTRIFVCVTALMAIGSLILFYGHFFTLAANSIMATLFPQSGLGGAIFIMPIIGLVLAAGLSWLISWWLLPVYRYLTRGKVMHSLLAAILALLIWPVLGLLVSTPAMIQNVSERQAVQNDIAVTTYNVSDYEDIFNVYQVQSFSRDRGDVLPQNPGSDGIVVRPKSSEVSGEFFIFNDTSSGKTLVQFRDSSGNVLEQSGDVCDNHFKSPVSFSPDNTKYASRLSMDGSCENLYVYDAVTNEAETFYDPGRMIQWLDNQYALLLDTKITRSDLKVFNAETRKIEPITSPHDRFRGGYAYYPSTLYEIGADLSEDKLWLVAANPIEDGEVCEVLLLSPQLKQQVVLTGLPLENQCDWVSWEEADSSLLVHEEDEEFRGPGRVFRIQFLAPDEVFSPAS